MQTGKFHQTGHIDTHDPCLYEQITSPWEVMASPVGPSGFGQSMTYLVTRRVILYFERFNGRLRLQGLSPPGFLALAIPVHTGEESIWWKTPLHRNGFPLMTPGGLDVEFSAAQSHFMILLDLGFVRDNLSSEAMQRIESAAQRHVLRAAPEAAERLGWMLGFLLREVMDQPGMLEHPATIRAVEQDLLYALACNIPESAPRRTGRGRRSREICIARAIDYVRSTDVAMTTVADLCAAARVSQRTLEYAFREAFGVSPLGFLHLRRFHATQKALRASDHKTAKVNEIAQANGFYQMGRFAVRYSALFGESPLQTLRRPPEEGEKPLLTFCGVGLK